MAKTHTEGTTKMDTTHYHKDEPVIVIATNEYGTIASHTNHDMPRVSYTVNHRDGTNYRYAEAELRRALQPGTRIEWTADIFGDGTDLITLTGTVLGPSTHYPTKTHVQCDDAVVSEHVDTDKIRAIKC